MENVLFSGQVFLKLGIPVHVYHSSQNSIIKGIKKGKKEKMFIVWIFSKLRINALQHEQSNMYNFKSSILKG